MNVPGLGQLEADTKLYAERYGIPILSSLTKAGEPDQLKQLLRQDISRADESQSRAVSATQLLARWQAFFPDPD